jgi:hypothetical protein
MECTKSEDNIWLLNSVVFFLVYVLFSGHWWCYCTPCEFPKAMLTDAIFLWNLLPPVVFGFWAMVLMCGAWERFSHSTCGKAFECGKRGSEISVA